MRRIAIFIAALVLGAANLVFAREEEATRLTGIINLPGRVQALFEGPEPNCCYAMARFYFLADNQRDGDLRMRAIAPAAGTVSYSLKDQEFTAKLAPTNSRGQIPSINLVNAGLSPVLRLYEELTGRTALRWPDLKTERFTLCCYTSDRLAMAQLLESALRQNGVVTIPDGDKFLLAVPPAEAERVKPNAPTNQPPSTSTNKSQASTLSQDEILPPGTIEFLGADPSQVLMIYAELLGGGLARPVGLAELRGRDGVFLRTQSPLSKQEAAYALGVLMAWRGVKLVPDGNGAWKVVSIK